MAGWYKVKPDYFDGELVKDFDCIIIGGYYENPYKKNYIQKYMLGAIEKADDGTFNVYAIGEVVHGLTVQERMTLSDSLKPHLVEHSGESEISFSCGKIFFGRNKPHAWIPPDKSIVLECRVSELARSREQYTEYTFRFPRISSVRRDKIWDESCTMAEFLEMCKSDDGRVKKTVMRQVNKSDLTSPSRKKKANTIEKNSHQDEEFEDLKIVDNVLEGKEFCVMSTNPKLPTIKDMKMMVRRHGGDITEYPRKGKTFAIIAGELTKMVQSFMNEKLYKVIKADWLVNNFGGESRKVHEMPKIRPNIDLLHATNEMKESLKELYDEYGDSYTDQFESVDELLSFLKTMKPSEEPQDLSELDDELTKLGVININFFRKIFASFFTLRERHFLFESAKSVLKFRAGTVVDLEDITKKKAFVIVDKSDDIAEVKTYLTSYSAAGTELIDFNWILESSDAGKVLEKDNYVVSTL